jgi:hypothetical protein
LPHRAVSRAVLGAVPRSGEVRHLPLASDGAGGVIVTWLDPTRQPTAGVLAAALAGIAMFCVMEANATAGRARIKWLLTGMNDSLEVERLGPFFSLRR